MSADIKCPECPNKDSSMFSEAAGGKKHLCLKCYHCFYKKGMHPSRPTIYDRPNLKPEEPKIVYAIPPAFAIEVKFLKMRLERLEYAIQNRSIPDAISK